MRADTLAIDVAALRAGTRGQPDFRLERLDRLAAPFRRRPGKILRRGIGRHGHRGHPPSVAGLGRALAHAGLHIRADHVEQAFPILRHEGIEIDQFRDTALRPVGDAGCDHAAIAVRDQHDVAQILEMQHAQHIGDMRIEIDVRRRQMRALAKPGIARREQIVSGRAKQRTHFLPGPSRRPGAMSNDDCGHLPLPVCPPIAAPQAAIVMNATGNANRVRLPHARARANQTKTIGETFGMSLCTRPPLRADHAASLPVTAARDVRDQA